MSEKLTDPSKAAHEIVEVLRGEAMRNDGGILKDANKNPWYLLATIYGEQEKFSEQNRYAWNHWYSSNNPAQHIKLTELLRQRTKDATIEVPDRSSQINFSNTYFPKGLDCSGFEFRRTVLFDSSVFEGITSFVAARFKGNACFRDAEFKREANFTKAIFDTSSTGDANFRDVRFGGGAFFRTTVFNEDADFHSAAFGGEAEFSSAQFMSTTDFTNARFLTHAPKFHAAELYDDTVFATPKIYTNNWPPLKGEDVMEAAEQKRAYNRLRLFMNKSLQIDEEQFFHRQEMRCKAVLAKPYHKPIYWIFEKVSDFGSSVARPLIGILLLIVIGAAVMLFHLEMGNPATSELFWTSTGWSISNMLPFLGFGKLYFGKFALGLPVWLKVLGGVQTLFGFILLFFLGLGFHQVYRLRLLRRCGRR